MSRFIDVALSWKGKPYTVRADQMMRVIALIEDHITLPEMAKPGAAPLAKVANAFAAVLNFAGAGVDPGEVYEGMFIGGDDTRTATLQAVVALQMLMVPPSSVVKGQSQGNPQPAAGASLKKPGKQRSAKDGSRRRTSGA